MIFQPPWPSFKQGSITASLLSSWLQRALRRSGSHSCIPATPLRLLPGSFILNDLFVHESGRRKGVGSQLLGAVEGYAWAHGAARVTLNVAIENTSGQALYEAQGWRKDAQFFMYHRFPASS